MHSNQLICFRLHGIIFMAGCEDAVLRCCNCISLSLSLIFIKQLLCFPYENHHGRHFTCTNVHVWIYSQHHSTYSTLLNIQKTRDVFVFKNSSFALSTQEGLIYIGNGNKIWHLHILFFVRTNCLGWFPIVLFTSSVMTYKCSEGWRWPTEQWSTIEP